MTSKQIADRLRELLELEHEPVAVSFLGEPPAGVPRFDGRAPSGCSFWRLAESSAFYTAPDDHLECPIGTLTMGFEIPPARREEAQKFFATLGELRYVNPEELDALPRMPGKHRFVLYGPLREAAGAPGAVLATGHAHQAMLLFETAKRLEMPGTEALTGRPTCGAVPIALTGSSIRVSLGCIGARVYLGLAPGEMVFVLPGERLAPIVEALEQVVAVNRELERFHARQRACIGGPAAR